jgi:hypothetical protein
LSDFLIFETDQFLDDLGRISMAGKKRILLKLRTYVYPQLRKQPYFGANIKPGLFTNRGGPQMRGQRGEAVLCSTANPDNEADGAGPVRPEGKNAP